MKLGAKTGCHQLHERSFSVNGFQFPVCARCTGLFFGQTAGLATAWCYYNRDIMNLLIPAAIFLVMLGIDGLGQYKKLWVSTNPRRFFTGITCGYFVMVFMVNIIKKGAEFLISLRA